MTLFLPLCPIFTSIFDYFLCFSLIFQLFLVFFLFLVFSSDVFDDFVTNRWQNGELGKRERED